MKILLTILLLVFATGCDVAGNYPINTHASVRAAELPNSWESRGRDCPLLWEKTGHSKMFFVQWDDPKIALKGTEAAARKGSMVAQKNAKELELLVKKNLILIRVALFYVSKEEILLRKAELEISFADGTVINDQGVLFWEKERNDAKKYDSRFETLHINRKWRKAREPLLLRILIPRQYLGREILSIDFVDLKIPGKDS